MKNLLNINLYQTIKKTIDNKNKTEENTNKPVDDSWKEVCRQFLLDFQNANSGDDYKFSLEYIDEDDIPEITICFGIEQAEPVTVFQYFSGQFKEIDSYGSMGCFEFVEKGNLIKSQWSNKGYITREFYSLKQGQDNKLITFWDNGGAVTTESEQIYKINDNVVGADEYSNELYKFNAGKTYKTVSYEDCYLINESNIDK